MNRCEPELFLSQIPGKPHTTWACTGCRNTARIYTACTPATDGESITGAAINSQPLLEMRFYRVTHTQCHSTQTMPDTRPVNQPQSLNCPHYEMKLKQNSYETVLLCSVSIFSDFGTWPSQQCYQSLYTGCETIRYGFYWSTVPIFVHATQPCRPSVGNCN